MQIKKIKKLKSGGSNEPPKQSVAPPLESVKFSYDVNVYLNYKNCWFKYKKNKNN